jgi:AcrR family transcriptional regulator
VAARRPPNRKALIRAAAADLFRQHGFHNVSVAQVADAVDITAPALYRHFANKQELLLDVVVHELEAIDAAARDSKDFDELVRALAVFATERQGVGALWQRESRHLEEEQRALIWRNARDTMADLVPLVGAPRPDLDDADIVLVALAVIGVFTGRRGARQAPAKRRYEQVLVRLARAVADTRFAGSAPPAEAAPDGDSAGSGLRMPRREVLFTEAIRLFDERGFQSVGLGDVAEASGVVRTAVYRYFSNKTELLVAAAVAAGERMRQGIVRALAGAREPREALELLLAAHIEVTMHDAPLVGILNHERDQLPDVERKRLQRFQEDTLDLWTQAFDNALPGRDPAEARVAIQAMQAMVYFVVRSDAVGGRPDLRERLVELGMALLQGL